MATFYKHHIMDWRSGTSGLSDRAYRVYHVIIEEIMLNDGPVPLHERSLAGKSNRSTRDFRAALAELIEAGKVIAKDGFLHNPRAEAELDAMQNGREKYPKGPRKGAENTANSPRKVDEYSANSPRIVRELEEKPNDISASFHTNKIREDKIREEKELSLSETSSDAQVLEFPEKAKQDKPKRQRNAYSAAFEEFWQAYPTDPLMSKAQAAKQFDRLSDEDQRKAIAAVPEFRAHCRKTPDYRPVHAERFISQRRFDGFARGSPEAIPFDPVAHQANLDRILGRTKANA